MAGPAGLSSRGEHTRKHRCEGNAIKVRVQGRRPCHYRVVRTPPDQPRTKSTTWPLYFHLSSSLGFCAVESLAHVQRRPWLSVFELFANSCRWRSNYYWKKRHVGRYRRGTAFATIEITLFVAYWGSFPHPCSERKRRPYKPGESGSLSQQERRRRQRRRHLQSDHKEAVKWARRSFRSDFVLAVLRRRAQEKVRTVIAPRKIRMLTGSFIYSLVCSTRFSRTALTLKTFEYTWTA